LAAPDSSKGASSAPRPTAATFVFVAYPGRTSASLTLESRPAAAEADVRAMPGRVDELRMRLR
jgi:hypothetical protein